MPTDPLLHMVIEDVFSIRGRGTVVTGRIDKGTLRPGDSIVLRGRSGDRTTVVAAVEAFRKVLDQASAGDAVGVLLADVSRDEVQQGDELLSPDFGTS
jgi:elongation factor Tu